MSFTRISLLESTQGKINVIGEPVSGAKSIPGSPYTVAINALNFTGRVYIEGSIALDPNDEDWFPLTPEGSSLPYLYFERDNTQDTGQKMIGFSFRGNLTWIRARQERDYLNFDALSPEQLARHGYINEIILVKIGF